MQDDSGYVQSVKYDTATATGHHDLHAHDDHIFRNKEMHHIDLIKEGESYHDKRDDSYYVKDTCFMYSVKKNSQHGIDQISDPADRIIRDGQNIHYPQ